jgi:hypothetical protein
LLGFFSFLDLALDIAKIGGLEKRGFLIFQNQCHFLI